MITTSLEGCTHRLADVGNRVHTRNDSDEDVRGNACNKAIAWKALPWSFKIQAISTIYIFLPELNVEVKPSRLLSFTFLTEGCAALAPGYLHRQADVYSLPGWS